MCAGWALFRTLTRSHFSDRSLKIVAPEESAIRYYCSSILPS